MNALFVIQFVICVLLVLSVLLQRGTPGLGTVFGGSVAETYRSRRGFEAFIFNFTIFLTVALAANSILISLLRF